MNVLLALTRYYSWYDFSDATVGLLFGLAGILFGYALRGLIGKFQAEAIEKTAQNRLAEADAEIKNRLKEADIQARAEVVRAREAFETSIKRQKEDVREESARLAAREENLDKKALLLEERERETTKRRDEVHARDEASRRRKEETDAAWKEASARLARLAGMTPEEARREVYAKAEAEVESETGTLIRRAQERAKEEADREARKIVVEAIQRYSVSHAGETMTTTVALPGDDIKGRIIGREGRNIRSIEAATGVTILMDETPGAVILSAFDPVRREIARRSLEKLVEDGRIHPTRIEEVVAEVTADMDRAAQEAGEDAAFRAQVQNIPAPVVKMLGSLRFRTSYSQNVLSHSVEVACLMGMMAGELGLDPAVARRIGLFHDIGKVIHQEKQGKHALLGAEFLKQNGEPPVVVNAVACHHEDVPAESLYGVLCSAADAISSSRPGARQEATAVYVDRLEKLEKIAAGFPGVQKTYALQAGREIRVIVDPGKTGDGQAAVLARDISRKIEATMQYPGQIKVIVVRETRCIEYAR